MNAALDTCDEWFNYKIQKANGKPWALAEARAVMENRRFIQFYDTAAFC